MMRVTRGALSRSIAVEVLEVSCGGCLLQTATGLEPGSFGSLHVELDGQTFCDYFRVSWSRIVEGAGSTYHSGVEFPALALVPEWVSRASLTSLVVKTDPAILP